MITARDLFAGSNLSIQYQEGHYKNLMYLIQSYKSLMFYRNNNSPAQALIQGFVIIYISGQPCPIPINMMLSANFPSSPPIIQIPLPNNIQVPPSNIINQQRCIIPDAIMRWEPRVLLVQYMHKVREVLSMNPPFHPNYVPQLQRDKPNYVNFLRDQPPPQYNQGGQQYQPSSPPQQSNQQSTQQLIDEAVAEASSIIDDANIHIKRAIEAEKEKALNEELVKVLNSKVSELRPDIENYQRQINEGRNFKVPEYSIDPALENECNNEAAKDSLNETMQAIRDEFRRGNMDASEYVSAIRTLHKKHFEENIAPLCQVLN